MSEQNQNPLVLVPESTAKLMKSISGKRKGSVDDLIYCHLYGVVGDWYLSEISENREKAFGFQIINSEPVWEMDNWLSNSSKWGEIPIKVIQELVNEKFLNENRNPKCLMAFGAMGAHINMALQALKATEFGQWILNIRKFIT